MLFGDTTGMLWSNTKFVFFLNFGPDTSLNRLLLTTEVDVLVPVINAPVLSSLGESRLSYSAKN